MTIRQNYANSLKHPSSHGDRAIQTPIPSPRKANSWSLDSRPSPTAIAQVAPAPPLYRTQTIPCPVALPLETAGKTVTCGVLTVPENYEQPHGRQVEITYARFHSTSLSPLPDPVLLRDLRLISVPISYWSPPSTHPPFG